MRVKKVTISNFINQCRICKLFKQVKVYGCVSSVFTNVTFINDILCMPSRDYLVANSFSLFKIIQTVRFVTINIIKLILLYITTISDERNMLYDALGKLCSYVCACVCMCVVLHKEIHLLTGVMTPAFGILEC